MMFKIQVWYMNGQKNWYIGTKTDFKRDTRFLGNLYKKMSIGISKGKGDLNA